MFILVLLAVKFLGVSRGIALDGDVGSFVGKLGVDLKPFLEPRLGVRLDRFCGAFRLAHAAVDALVRVNHQKVRAFVEAVHRADFHAIGVFALDAVVGDDEGHV